MRIHIDIDTADTLSENDKVILLALAGEISLGEGKAAEVVYEPAEPISQDKETVHEGDSESAEGSQTIYEAVAENPRIAKDYEPGEAPGEPEKAPKKVQVSEASLKKYGFHVTDDGKVQCDHCDFVSETGRALHLHAGTHKEDEAPKPTLKSVKDEPEAGVDAFLGSEEPTEEEDVADAEAAEAGDPEPAPEPVEAKVVETDPKVLRDKVAKIATAMVAAERHADIRKVLDEDLGGVARVSMIAEGDLQKFLDRIWDGLTEADRDKFFKDA